MNLTKISSNVAILPNAVLEAILCLKDTLKLACQRILSFKSKQGSQDSS